MMKLAIATAFILLATTAHAHAFVITAVLLPFIGGALAGIGVVTPLIGMGSLGVVNAGFAAMAFLTTPFGSYRER